jgi:hypothetical protein
MSAASVSLAIGAAAASNVTDGASTRCDPGMAVTIALQSSTGIKRWIVREDGTDFLGLDGFVYQADTSGVFSTVITLPRNTCVIPFQSSTWDGSNESRVRFTVLCFPAAIGQYHRVTAVQTTAVADLTAATVSVDSQTLTQGQTVLLVNQSTGAQNGIYQVGVVAGGNAPLTRLPDLASGAVIPSPQVVEVEKGTVYGGSSWKTSNTGDMTVGTTTMTFFPRMIRGFSALSSGTINITSQWIQTGAFAYATCNSAKNVIQATVPTAGSGNGFCVFNGTGTDGCVYMIVNWG